MTILHLSDIHFKRKEKETYREDVQGKMIYAIKTHLEKYHPEPVLVAVTGDIAFSGKEYDEAKAFFKQLKTVLPTNIKFLIVPGNHDIDREEINDVFSLHSVVSDTEKVDRLLESRKQINFHINPKFKAFREFAGTLKPKLYKNDEDYFWVKDFKYNNVSFLGLNSCWACENDQDKDNITLGYPQVMDALKRSKLANRVVLMHHPPINWLNEIDFNRYSSEIFHNCQLMLHGHTHADNALVFKSPSHSCICLGANASYTKNRNGFIGFQFIEVEFREKGVGVKVWPYRLRTGGRVRFAPDTHRWEGQDGPFFQLKTFEHDTKPKKKKITHLSLEIPKEYKNWVEEFHSTMDIDLLAKKGEVITVNLPEVYIPVETRNPFYKPKEEDRKRTESEKYILEGMDEPGPGKDSKSKEPPSIDIEKY